ncbi:putative permease YjgP/YjgQ family protein [Thalassoglobus polymorphus]|uniref:Putative permease YjgP/YjgQ family protein n=2 Tax=Thalassoglobus polymorphus TaxID=2527994 RepID=A0A517QL59_9PLAN|nr:putative permease YjgP/YjgQ family protein [Thalassoglobus polymorphus]
MSTWNGLSDTTLEMPFKIPILQRYILWEVLRVFAFVLTCITVLLVFVGVFQQATERGLTPAHALQVLPFVVPHMLPFTIPAAMLLTVSLVYGRLAGDQEVIAAKSAGIHPVSLMLPALFLGATLSAGTLVLSDQMIPWSMTKIEQHAISVLEDVFIERLRTELQFSDRGTGLHVHVAAVDDRKLIHPVFRYAKNGRIVTMQAEEAELRLDLKRQEVVIAMTNGFIELPGDHRVFFSGTQEERIRWEREDEVRKARDLPILSIGTEIEQIESFRETQKKKRAIQAFMSMTGANFQQLVGDVKTTTKELNGDRKRYNKLNTEVHSRYAMACSCFFFALLGSPVAIRFGQSQFLKSFMLCFVPIVCGYYPLMLGLMAQSKNGHISPVWSMWIANLIVIALSWFVMRKVVRY